MTESCTCPPAGTSACELRVTPARAACPTNGRIGQAIDSLTLKALLAWPLTQLRSRYYRFCRAADCPTVYYSADGEQVFDESALRERVYQKHAPDDDVLVCYCFRHTIGDIRAELLATGSTTVVESITAGIQAGQCACDIRNPQGSCCLGNVHMVVRRLRSGMGLC